MASELWMIGCAVIITALWRWRVDNKYHNESRQRTVAEQVQRTRRMVYEAFARRRMGLYPLTSMKITKTRVVAAIMQRWEKSDITGVDSVAVLRTMVGMFDGGSRGNPGPGGSGSWVIATGPGNERNLPSWAAATALGHRDTTNNVAEFIGLQRLLAKAVQQNWKRIHMVGDSALILGMIRDRRPPKARKLTHWYRVSRRLADICQVASWTHQYRRHNKVANWLANWAMDRGSSKTWAIGDASGRQALADDLRDIIAGDIQQWLERAAQQEQREE